MATGTYINDLEPPAFAVLPPLKALREDLRALGFTAVMMSGSGSTIFCVGDPDAKVRDTWKGEIIQKHGADIFEEAICQRLPDERLWYAEQPE